MQYFGSNIVECVAENWVEAEMSWVEVDGGGWRWVHGLVIRNNSNTKSNRTFLQAHAGLQSLLLHVKISYGFGISIVYMIFRDVFRIL